MRALIVVTAAVTLSASAAAKDLIAPASEAQLEQRIVLFQQEARDAHCDPQEPVCSKGRYTLAFESVKLAHMYPDCGGDQACRARKKARETAAAAFSFAPASAAKDVYVEAVKTGKQPAADVAAAYIAEVTQTLATSTCPASEKVCAIGRLAYLVEIDQLARYQVTACFQIGAEQGPDARKVCLTKAGAAIEPVDKLCRAELARITDRFGWPDAVHWGATTAFDAWLLAQHADPDQKLQAKFLKLIKASFERGTTPAQDYAYIADRQAGHLKKPQLYGTQGNCYGEGAASHWEPNPIADEAHLDARRAAAGMGPYEEYRKANDQMCQGKL